jgi:hypothetical protein
MIGSRFERWSRLRDPGCGIALYLIVNDEVAGGDPDRQFDRP